MFSKKDPPKIEAVCVYTTQVDAEARLVQELLRNNGIGSVIQSEISPLVYPITTGDLGRKDILVMEPDADRATEILDEFYEANDDNMIDDEIVGEE